MINIAKNESAGQVAVMGTGSFGASATSSVDFKTMLLSMYNKPGEILRAMANKEKVTLMGQEYDTTNPSASMMLAANLEINSITNNISLLMGIKGTFYSSFDQKLNQLLGM